MKSKINAFKFTPGGTINLNNNSSIPQTFEVEFGEYGTICVDVLPGATIPIKCGSKPPKIKLLEPKFKPGLKPVK